jgi:hypothetical protein
MYTDAGMETCGGCPGTVLLCLFVSEHLSFFLISFHFFLEFSKYYFHYPRILTVIFLFLLTLRLIASFGHEAQDMKTFADWGVDYIKVDFCYLCSYANQPQQPATTYAMFRDAILATNRSIIFRYQSIYFIHFISFHFIPVQFSSVLFCFVRLLVL